SEATALCEAKIATRREQISQSEATALCEAKIATRREQISQSEATALCEAKIATPIASEAFTLQLVIN
ncbi:hypothetical protein, partial [Leptospira santarosai]|uniref:hypothetical protein n=1 Tax=Leptospira santarosai TaxID=28183 RepID=UPI0024AE9A16